MSRASEEASQRIQPMENSRKGVNLKKIKVEQLPYTLRYKHASPTIVASKVDSDWADITDTNLGPFNYGELYEETFNKDVSGRTKRIFQPGLAHVALFPFSIQCSELILAATGAYNPATRQCVDLQGNVIIDLTP